LPWPASLPRQSGWSRLRDFPITQPAPGFFACRIFSAENRFPLFRTML
jgi:hypothetical protein